jgi:SpoVK/Ycf46/Vps4 family AAA+-type ATPase
VGVGEKADELDGALDLLAAQFDLDGPRIHASVAEALASVDGAGLADALWDAGRARARASLEGLAQRIEPVATRGQLVLPADSMALLDALAAHVRNRATVYEQWGFGAQGRRGLGISALFTGPSGTGKTMAAEVLAGELRLDLYRIDLSAVVSKYVGETEKNLRRVFDAAEEGGVLLFFDEADALFGKRSEVKDSHDRFANIEINYLLQRMEDYRGVAVLATNMKGALDPAFLRRIRFVVSFPIPDLASRTEIWRGVFPPSTPTDGLDPRRLAQLTVTGGSIHNIAINAAFMAADQGEPVRMDHVLRATRMEFAKIERPLPESDIRDWI